MRRQFTIREMGLWAVVMALWMSVASMQWITRFGIPPANAESGLLDVIAAAIAIAVMTALTVIMRIPLRAYPRSWWLSAFIIGVVVYGVLFVPSWILDVLDSRTN